MPRHTVVLRDARPSTSRSAPVARCEGGRASGANQPPVTAMPKQQRQRTKVVVRGLPPGLTEDALRAAVDKAAGARYGWTAYYPGKARWARVRMLPVCVCWEASGRRDSLAAAGQHHCSNVHPPWPTSRVCSAAHTLLGRAYFDFLTHDDVVEFKSKFDGHVFVSAKGTQFR